MFKKRIMLVLGVMVVFSMLLSACGTPTPVIQTVEVEKIVEKTVEVEKVVEKTVEVEVEKIVEVTPTAIPTTRTGAWVDSVIFTEQNSAEAAVKQLQAGELDIYAYTVNNDNLFKTVQADPTLAYSFSFGSVDEITLNPTVFTDEARLNPWSNPKIREALNWLIDRNYVVQEIFSGRGTAKFFAVTAAFPDYARYIDVTAKLEAFYAYSPEKAQAQITAEMEAMGATLKDGKWSYKDAPVTLIFIIRTEDERKLIGDYVSNQLETVGFTVDRQYKTRSEASPIWVQSDPLEGQWNMYTGGWITTAVSRDQGSNFSFYYTPRDYPIPLHQAYTPTAAFDEVALKLRNNDFKSMDERRALFTTALELSMQDSARVWVIDAKSFSPRRANTMVGYDLAGAIAGAQIWPFTARFTNQEGGVLRVAQPGVLVDPWNPVGGSNWIYDMMPIRATSDWGAISDPYTGLAWPQRIEKADVVAAEGTPMAKTLDWVTLTFEPTIAVPADAWADWDAVNQKFITVGEKYPDGTTAVVKSTVYYPANFWTTVKWHDGSPITMGDFVMSMIMSFDPGKEDSAIFDEALKANIDAFLAHFKGVKVVSVDPLVIETYDDLYALDAENTITTWFPNYGYGMGAWHNIAVGVRAETDGKLAFTTDKATANEIEWMNFISGPSLDILSEYLVKSTEENFVPFAATMGTYVTADEATARWANLTAWFTARNHFWLGTGPFYLYKVFPVEGTVQLQRFVDYPDMANKWDRFGAPKLAVAEVDGAGQIAVGAEAKFDVFVTYNEQPYPASEISEVKYLVFNAAGELLLQGAATSVADGQYTFTLTAEDSAKLVAGSYKLEVVVSPLVVSVPTFVIFEFVTQ